MLLPEVQTPVKDLKHETEKVHIKYSYTGVQTVLLSEGVWYASHQSHHKQAAPEP